MFSVRCFIGFLFYVHFNTTTNYLQDTSETTAATANIFFSEFYNCLKLSGEILKSELLSLIQVV